jgi:hypothetical protein
MATGLQPQSQVTGEELVCAKLEGGLELLGHGVWRGKTEDGSGGLTSCGQQPVNATVVQSRRAELGKPFHIETVEEGRRVPDIESRSLGDEWVCACSARSY